MPPSSSEQRQEYNPVQRFESPDKLSQQQMRDEMTDVAITPVVARQAPLETADEESAFKQQSYTPNI